MSTANNLDKVSKTEDREEQHTDGNSASLQKDVEAIEDRLVTLSEKIHLCRSVVNDLRDLNDKLVRKRLEDVCSQPQK